MSGNASQDSLASTIISAEPPTALIAALETHSIGILQVELHPLLFHPNSSQYLLQACLKNKMSPQRQVLEEDVARIRESLQVNEVSSYNFPLVAAVAPDSWRNVEQQLHSEIELFDASAEEQKLATFIKDHHVVSKEDLGSAMLVLLDGQARLRILLEDYDPAQPRSIFVHLYTSAVIDRGGSFSQVLFELLHGTNLRQVYLSNPAVPDFGDQIRQLHLVRNGHATSRLTGTIKSEIAPAFFAYLSSRMRSTLASQILTLPFIKPMLRTEKPTRIAALLQQFGAATPVLLHALRETEMTLSSLDPNNTFFDANFFFYLSHIIDYTNLENPLSVHPSNRGVPPQVRCTKIADLLRQTIDQRIKPRGEVELSGFTSVFSKRMPSWIKGDPSLELAEDIIQRFERFIETLEDQEVSKDLQPRPQRLFCNHVDLISLNLQTKGTQLVRWVAILEYFFLTPLAELLAAYVQLSRNDPKLALPSQYWKTFKDAEPFFIELISPGKGVSIIRAGRRKVKNLELWPEPATTKQHYYRFTRRLWYSLSQIVHSVLEAKARLASLSDVERDQLLATVLDPAWVGTPQAAVIRQNLHLALFRIQSDRTLSPAIPPRRFSRCNTWVHPSLDLTLRTLGDTDDDNTPTLFTSFSKLVEENRVSELNSGHDQDLLQLLDELVVVNQEGVKLKDLPSTIEERLHAIESLKTDTLLEPLAPDPIPPQPTPPAPLAHDTPHHDDEVPRQDEPEYAVDGNSDWKGKKRARSEGGEDNEKRAGDEEGGVGEDEGGEVDQDGVQKLAIADPQTGNDQELNDARMSDQGLSSAAVARHRQATTPAPPTKTHKKARRRMKRIDSDSDFHPPKAARSRKRLEPTSSASSIQSSPSSVISENHLFRASSLRVSSSSNSNTADLLTSAPLITSQATSITSKLSTFALELLLRFRSSNCYPPLGHSYDENTFTVDDFHHALSVYVFSLEQTSNDQPETDVESQPSPDVETDPSPNELTCLRIFGRISDVLLEVLARGEGDGIYEYWQGVEEEMKEEEEG